MSRSLPTAGLHPAETRLWSRQGNKMDTEEVVRQAERLRTRIREYARRGSNDGDYGVAAQAQVCEFLRHYAGQKNEFLKQAEAASGYTNYLVMTLDSPVASFIEYLQAGLAT